MKTYVFLTIDTEVSMGYAWGDSDLEPLDTDTCVWCRQPNGKEYGIGMIMGILEKFGLKGVFFVDASIHENFGAGPFHEICGSILDRGHDLQLHLHPAAWQYAILRRNGPVQGRPAEVRDLLHCYDRGMQESFIEKACNVFEKACGQRPTAFRAGSFGADETTLTAIARAGIPADFSSNAALMGVTCKVGGKATEHSAWRASLKFLSVRSWGTGGPGPAISHWTLTLCLFRRYVRLFCSSMPAARDRLVLLLIHPVF